MQGMQTKLCFWDDDTCYVSALLGAVGEKLPVAAFLWDLKSIPDLCKDASPRLCDHGSQLS